LPAPNARALPVESPRSQLVAWHVCCRKSMQKETRRSSSSGGRRQALSRRPQCHDIRRGHCDKCEPLPHVRRATAAALSIPTGSPHCGPPHILPCLTCLAASTNSAADFVVAPSGRPTPPMRREHGGGSGKCLSGELLVDPRNVRLHAVKVTRRVARGADVQSGRLAPLAQLVLRPNLRKQLLGGLEKRKDY